MEKEKIARINELWHKKQNEGLTEEEKKEQSKLRKEYIKAIKNNVKGQLKNYGIQKQDNK